MLAPGHRSSSFPKRRRANAYLEAGVDCVYPTVLYEEVALRSFVSEVGGPANVIRLPQMPSLAEVAELGVPG